MGHPAVVGDQAIKKVRVKIWRPKIELSSQPERTRISCYAALTSNHVCGFQ